MMTPEEIAKLKQLAADNGILPLGGADEIAAALNSNRRKIELPGDERELIHFAEEVGDELKAHDFYRRDRLPVGINREKARLDAITPQALRSMSQKHLVFFKTKEVGSGSSARSIDIVKTMNVDTARGLLESWEFLDKLPDIERVNPIRMPVMRRDGRIDLAPAGYFAEGGIYTLDRDVVYDEAMTMERAKQVIATELLGEMPFHDKGRSLAVQVAAMLTVFGASLLPRGAARPGFIYTANASDAGKTLAVKMVIIPILGKVNSRAMPRKEETRKVLDQIAMEAWTTILFDNVKGTLGGEDIEAFMSAERWSGRVLGGSGGFEVDQVTTCFFTGNASRPTEDMLQRCLFVELFIEEIDPSKRVIKNTLTGVELAEPKLRSEICSALWTLIKHWDAKGRPAGKSSMPKCPTWSTIIGGIVVCAGFEDPCAKADVKSARTGVYEMQELVKHLAKSSPAPVQLNQTMELGAEAATADEVAAKPKEWTFSDIMDEVKAGAFFENLELHGRKGDAEEMFDADGAVSPAGRSFFGRFLVTFDGRLFAGESGGRLRWVVKGKGNSKRYLVVREG